MSQFRSDREKSILQGKLRMVQKNIIESSGRPQLVSSGRGQDKEATPTSGEEKHQLKSRIYELESEVCKLSMHVYTYVSCMLVNDVYPYQAVITKIMWFFLVSMASK